jgi:glycosyltransferase involved in cell wall biosynthesis
MTDAKSKPARKIHLKPFAPRISIVMPVRNAARTLAHALASIRSQKFTDWELVAVDDGSQDGTAGMLAAAARRDRRVRILSQPALGIAEALRRGCAAARGEFIARMDADDVMMPERLGRQLEFAKRNPELGVVSCRVRYGGNAESQAGYAAYVAWSNSLIEPAEIALRRFVEAPVAHPTVMFRRVLMGAYGGYAAGDFPEDYELWLRWMDAGVRFGKVDAELLVWNDAPVRLSRTDERYRVEAFYRVKCDYLARWLKREIGTSREIWLWGAGRVTRRRFRNLESAGIPLVGFIDIDAKKTGRQRDGRAVVAPGKLPLRTRAFILAGVSARGARERIAADLESRGWSEGRDYLLAA